MNNKKEVQEGWRTIGWIENNFEEGTERFIPLTNLELDVENWVYEEARKQEEGYDKELLVYTKSTHADLLAQFGQRILNKYKDEHK